MESLRQIVLSFRREYDRTPTKLKLIDGFIVYTLATAGLQLAYMLLVGSFPFNAFLSGLLCCLGMFVFAVCLRMQTDPENRDEFEFSTERAFGDFCFASLTLFLIAWNFIG